MMKKVLLLPMMMCLLCITSVFADSENILKIHDVEANAGETITIEIEILNDDEVIGFNCDIPLPEGFSVDLESGAHSRTSDHSLSLSVIDDNTARLMLFSLSNALLEGNEGVVATFDVETPETPGTYTLDITGIPVIGALIDGTSTNVLTGTESGEVSLTGQEYTLTIEVVGEGNADVDGVPYTEPVVAPEGSSLTLEAIADTGWQFDSWAGDLTGETSPAEITMDDDKNITATFTEREDNIMLVRDVSSLTNDIAMIELEIINSDEFAGFNADIILPAGFNYIEGSEELHRKDDHLMEFEVIEGNVARMISFSPTLSSYTGNDGVIVSFEVETPATADTYLLELDNTIIGNADQEDILTEAIDGEIILEDQFTVSLDVAGEGSVAIDPEQDFFEPGEEIELTATPDQGWEFVEWTGDTDLLEDANDPNPTFDMPATSVELTANFAMIDYELTVNIIGEGSVGFVPIQDFYNIGDEITLTPTPDEGWEFEGWTGDTEFLDGNVLTMPADDVELTATFIMSEYDLTINIVGEGQVDIDPDQEVYNFGDEITLTPTPDEGWEFEGWTGDTEFLDENVLTIPADDVTLTANFVEEGQITITYVAGTGGSVNPESETLAPATGEAQGSTATPDPGYSFVNWTDEDNAEVGTDLHFTPDKVDGVYVEATYTANFEMIDYTLTVNTVGEGSVAIDPDEDFYNIGDEITLTPTPDAGWEFEGWTGDTEFLDGNVLTMPADDVTLTANFEKDEFILSFLVKDPEEFPIAGAEISINGQELITGGDGTAEIALDIDTYNYIIEVECLLDETGEVEISDDDVHIDVVMTRLLGDVTDNGVVNTLDMIAIAKYYTNQDPEPFCFDNADVNQDGEINVIDILLVATIYLNGDKITPYPGMQSEEAHLFLHKNGITLESDGTLAGLQFEMEVNARDDLSLELQSSAHQMMYHVENGMLKAMIFSMDNTPLPGGKIDLIAIHGATEMPEWTDALAGNLNAQKVPVHTHTQEITGTDDLAVDIGFHAYPNPANDIIRVEFLNQSQKPAEVTLMTLQGQIVERQLAVEKGQANLRFDVSEMPPGIYMIRLSYENSIAVMDKVIVK